ncbi:hypothetical protein [Tenacibaculum amylolyticum]|uniref:hypothetical protein n=1 Tax=Tenacibaculum amylolyticum TaxID=104269 RepID=UPI00389674C0
MSKLHSYIILLSTLLLSVGLQFTGSQATLYASPVKTSFSLHNHHTTLLTDFQDEAVVHHNKKEQERFFAEIEIEEVEDSSEEEYKTVKLNSNTTVFHTFYLSFPDSLKVKSQKKNNLLVQRNIVTTIPLYLELQVFRL